MFFEILMLFCFGAAWPLAIMKTVKAKSVEGKSLFFTVVIMMGYLSGVFYKYFYNFDKVIYLYVLNFIMVAVDLTLTLKKKKDRRIIEELERYQLSLGQGKKHKISPSKKSESK